MKRRIGIMTFTLGLGVMLLGGVAQATLYTPPMDWPNSLTDTRNPYTDTGTGGTWTAYWQPRSQTRTGTYNLSQAGDRGGGVANWIASTGQWPAIRTPIDSTSVEFCIYGTAFTPSDGWGVLSFQPAEGGDVSITGQLAVVKDWRSSYPLSITAEIIKLNAAGDVAEVLGSTAGLRLSTAAWSFNLTTTMLATDTIRIRMIDMEPSGAANGRVTLSNYQIDVTPEPASLSLLTVGGLGVLLRKKR